MAEISIFYYNIGKLKITLKSFEGTELQAKVVLTDIADIKMTISTEKSHFLLAYKGYV